MPNKSINAIFFITSPFQALCALEAISAYKIFEPFFYIIQNKTKKNTTTKNILFYNKFENVFELNHDTTISVLQHAPRNIKAFGFKKMFFDYIFIGDYFNPSHCIYASYLSNRKNKLIFLDDGNSTIEALYWGRNIRRFHNSNNFIKMTLIDLVFQLKGIKAKEFFSIFAVNSNRFLNTLNTFEKLKEKISVNTRKCIFILGSASHFLLTDQDYLSELDKIFLHIENNHPNEDIYYCPHRVESLEFIKKLTSNKLCKIFTSKFTIEMDSIMNGIEPIAVYSFMSTASYSLKVIYPEIFSYTVTLHRNRKSIDKPYKVICEVYKIKNIVQI